VDLIDGRRPVHKTGNSLKNNLKNITIPYISEILSEFYKLFKRFVNVLRHITEILSEFYKSFKQFVNLLG